MTFKPSVDDQHPGVRSHEQLLAVGRIKQSKTNGEASLQPDPIDCGRHIRYKFAAALIAADATGDALDMRAIEAPWMGVEPNPRLLVGAEMAQVIFFVVCYDAPGVRIDDRDGC